MAMRQVQVNVLPKVAVGKGGRLAQPLVNLTGRPLHFSYRGKDELIPPNPGIEYYDPKYRFCLGLSVREENKSDTRLTKAQQTIEILRKQLLASQEDNRLMKERLDHLDTVVTEKVNKVWTQGMLREMGKNQIITIAQEFDPDVVIGTKNDLIEFILSWQKESGSSVDPEDSDSESGETEVEAE